MSAHRDSTPITQLLESWSAGEEGAADAVMPEIYDRLCRIAARWQPLCLEDPALQHEALAHDAYLRLAALKHPRWSDREHFFAFAAKTVRSVMMDHVRASRRLRRGGDWERVDLDEKIPDRTRLAADRLALAQALVRLRERSPRQAAVVELHVVVGLSVEETAKALGCGTATVSRDWRSARARLVCDLSSCAEKFRRIGEGQG